MGMDSRDGLAREILPASTSQNKPLLCDGGNRVVVSRDFRVCVVDWDGQGLREITDGIASDIWPDPSSGIEWVFVRTGDTATNPIYRYNLDNPADSVLVWDQSSSGDYYMNWWQVSADGRVAADFLPWNRCFLIDNGALASNGVRTGIGRGCWSSLASDNSYISVHYPVSGGHSSFVVWRHLDSLATVPLDPQPRIDGTTTETFHPRFASKGGRFLVLTSGYAEDGREGDSVEIYAGRWAADYRSMEQWVRVTDNLVRDYTPDLWVGVEPPAPSIQLSSSTLRLLMQDGDTGWVDGSVAVTTPSGALEGLAASADSSWLRVSLSAQAAAYIVHVSANAGRLGSGKHRATVTLSCNGARPQSRTLTVEAVVTGTPVPTSLALTPQSSRVPQHDTLRFSIIVRDQTDSVLNSSDVAQWSVAGLDAHVDQSGVLVAADSTGVCTVSVSVGALNASSLVTVTGPQSELVRLLAPITPLTVFVGSRLTVRWAVRDPSILFMHVKASADNGRRWAVATEDINKWQVGTSWQQSWLVPDTLVADDGGVIRLVSDSVLVRPCDIWDDSVGATCPVALRILPAVHVDSPARDTAIWPGDSVRIAWTVAPYISGVLVEVSTDNGDSWSSLVSGSVQRSNREWDSLYWVAPRALAPGTLLVRVSNYADRAMSDVADGTVVVRGAGVTLVTSSLGDTVRQGDTVTVRWHADTSTTGTVRVLLTDTLGNILSTVSAQTDAGAMGWGSFEWPVAFDDSLIGVTALIAVGDTASRDEYARTAPFTLASPRAPLDATVDEPGDAGDESNCGCGAGSGLALLPPLWFSLRKRVRRARR